MSTRAAPRQAPAPARTRPRSRPSSRPAAARPPRARRRARLRMGKWVIPLVALVLAGIVWVNVAKLTVTHRTGEVIEKARARRGRDRPSQEPVRAAQRHGDRACREAPRDGVAAELGGDLPGRQDALGDGGRILAPAAPTPPAREPEAPPRAPRAPGRAASGCWRARPSCCWRCWRCGRSGWGPSAPATSPPRALSRTASRPTCPPSGAASRRPTAPTSPSTAWR